MIIEFWYSFKFIHLKSESIDFFSQYVLFNTARLEISVYWDQQESGFHMNEYKN